MTDDIVTRLREEPCGETWCEQCKIYSEAADEIERLRNIIKAYINAERGVSIVDDNLKLFVSEHAQQMAWREAYIDLAREADRED